MNGLVAAVFFMAATAQAADFATGARAVFGIQSEKGTPMEPFIRSAFAVKHVPLVLVTYGQGDYKTDFKLNAACHQDNAYHVGCSLFITEWTGAQVFAYSATKHTFQKAFEAIAEQLNKQLSKAKEKT